MMVQLEVAIVRAAFIRFAFLVISFGACCYKVEKTVGGGPLQAGAFAKNIDPKSLPVWSDGGIAGRQIDRITDSLHAKSLVLSDGKNQVAFCVVDSCMLPLELIDRAKQLILERVGIQPSHVMIASTHAHSAVSVFGVHGTPIQEDYAADLPGWIADSVEEAQKRLELAQWGTTSVVCDRYIYCRDWMMKTGKAPSSLFSGRNGDIVSMNPGYENPDKLAPVGPVDTLVPILSIQNLEGRPISLLATFCTHYAGAPNLSADYFGIVGERLAKALRPIDPKGFVGIMSNSTSGNANCVDFSKPSVPFTHVDVGTYVSERILSSLPSIRYSSEIELDAELQSIEVAVRMPSETEVSAAKRYIETHFPDRLPLNLDENYARETVMLSTLPSIRKLMLQAFRLNNFVITANPCETYNESGLKIRQHSPFDLTMNVGLANGYMGYIPPPEMFQLGGYTTWRCRSSCLEEEAEPKMVEGLNRVMQALHQRRALADLNSTTQSKAKAQLIEPESLVQNTGVSESDSTSNPASPVSPRDSLRWFETQEGFQVELVASEPNIVDPVSMQIDEKGRIWAVEMQDYPSADQEPKSRIVVLEDKDRDGFFESSQVFADRLLFATGVQPWQDGALVTVQGKLLMLRDRDGDMRADEQEVWLDGFAAENPQLRANHPMIAADGWLYIASGLRGGKITSTIPFGQSTSEPVDLMGADLRVHMLTGRMESIAGPAQFGHALDRLGQRYGCSNRQPCFEILSERRDIGMSPLAGLATPIHEVSPGEAASKVYPLVNAWTTSNLHAGQFTAACGVTFTHSSLFDSGKVSNSQFGTVLTCEPTAGVVQRRSVGRIDGRSIVIDQPLPKEWLASHDPWFRPVDICEGPKGEIYIVDMYRAVIEHPDWVPKELKERTDQRYGDQHGRIYRVTRRDANALNSTPVESTPTYKDIANWIRHSDSWNRSVASRLFLERMSSTRDELLLKSIRDIALDTNPNTSIGTVATAVFLMGSVDALDEELVSHLLRSKDGERREIAWNALRESMEPWGIRWDPAVLQTMISQDSTPDELRLAMWFFARQWIDSASVDLSGARVQIANAAAQALIRHGDDHQLWMASAAANRGDLANLLEQYRVTFSKSTEASLSSKAREAVVRLANRVAIQSDELSNQKWLERCEVVLLIPENARVRSLHFAILEGVLGAGKNAILADSKLERIILQAAKSDSDFVNQQAALQMLASLKSDTAKKLALEMLDSQDVTLAKIAIRVCSVHNTAEFSDWLLDRFGSSLPVIRSEMFQAIQSSTIRLTQFLDRLEAGKMSIRLMDASQVQSMRLISETSLASRVAKVLDASVQANRQKVIDDYTESLREIHVDENTNRGKIVFGQNCSACHRLNSAGTAIGPDISDSREQSFEKLLVSVLDPNRSIDANYFRYMARTDDGRVVEGLLKDANAQTITLYGQNGATILERSEIEEFKSSGASLMPEGIEAQISPQDMADLLWYIKNWRYAEEKIPVQATARP